MSLHTGGAAVASNAVDPARVPVPSFSIEGGRFATAVRPDAPVIDADGLIVVPGSSTLPAASLQLRDPCQPGGRRMTVA